MWLEAGEKQGDSDVEVSMRRMVRVRCFVTQAKGRVRERGVVVNKRDSYTSISSALLCG